MSMPRPATVRPWGVVERDELARSVPIRMVSPVSMVIRMPDPALDEMRAPAS